MKAYKAVSKNIPHPLTYIVGKTYSIDSMKICSHGFHFCEKMKDVLRYHSPSKSFKLFEVEVLGKVETDGDKGVTDKMKIIREIPPSEHKMFEVDPKGNEIHFKDSDGRERWYEYDSNGNEIHFKNSDGAERWCEYDSEGKQVHFKSSSGYEHWKEYDSNGNMIRLKDSDGHEYCYEYDSNGNDIYHKDSHGCEEWKEYDSNGNMIHLKKSGLEWRITIDT